MNNFETSNYYILVIETSVSGGSISLMQNYNEIDCWEGSGTVSKAEDVLEAIALLLSKNHINKNQIKQIVVSKGPGSFTGTRIGLAISLGLQKSLDCDIYGLSLLESMTYQFKGKTQCVTAVPVGDRQVCFQSFEVDEKNKFIQLNNPNLLFLDSFFAFTKSKPDITFILHKKLFETILKNAQYNREEGVKIFCSQGNLSTLLGKHFVSEGASDNVQPIYVQPLTLQ